MITYQIKRLTTKKKRVLYITSKAPNYYIEELIKSGEYKKLNIKYYSPLWLRFQLVKYLINIKDKRKEFIPESPKANDEISFHNLSLEKNRKGINFKLSTLLLLIWSFLFPFQGNLAGSLYEKYSAGHFIKGKKKLVYAKPNLINKVFPFLFPNNYYLTEKDLTIKTDLSIEGILNLEIPEKSDVVLSAFDSLEKQLFVKNIKTSNKLKHKIELNRFDKLSDDGKYKILLLSNNFASSFEFSKVGDKYFYSPNKKQNFLKLNYQLNKNDRRYAYSKNIEKVTLHNKDSLIANRNSDSTYNYETNIKTGLSRRRFLKTAGLVTAAFFVPKSVFTSPKDTLSVYVPDVEGIKYNGSLVEVFDDFGNSLGSGTTIDSLATFLVTGVEDDNAIKTKANVSFNPVTKELTYSLDGSSRVDVRLSDMLGRQRKIYSGNGHSGENTIKLNLDGLSSGRYVISVETNKYASNIMFTGDGNLITGLKSSGILHKQGTRLKDGALKKAMGDNYKIVVSGPDHYTRTFVVPVQNNIEDRVVGYDGKDSSGNIISVIDDGNMTPERFKQWMDWSYFNTVLQGGQMYPHVLPKWTESTNNNLPEKLYIAQAADHPNTGTSSTMDQVTIDRIVNRYNERIKPLLGQKDIPIVMRANVNSNFPTLDGEYQTVTIWPSGSGSNPGWSNIHGALPATIDWGNIGLVSGPPNGDVGEPKGTSAFYQEFMTAVFGARAPPSNQSIMGNNETITMDNTELSDFTKYDEKSIKLLTNDYLKAGEHIDMILGL